MLPFLIYCLIKKYSRQQRFNKIFVVAAIQQHRLQLIIAGLLLLLLAIIPVLSKAQPCQLNYKIIKGGDEIGWLTLEKKVQGNTCSMLMVSEVSTRMIFQINVSTKETAAFEDGKLIFSSQYRKTNGNTKVDKQTRFVIDKYEVVRNGKKQDLDFHFIGTNLLSMYFNEPVGINFVYCDNQESFVSLEKKEDGGYRVTFPDGNSNCFYYSGGICNRIKVTHTFYSAEIILKP